MTLHGKHLLGSIIGGAIAFAAGIFVGRLPAPYTGPEPVLTFQTPLSWDDGSPMPQEVIDHFVLYRISVERTREIKANHRRQVYIETLPRPGCYLMMTVMITGAISSPSKMECTQGGLFDGE